MRWIHWLFTLPDEKLTKDPSAIDAQGGTIALSYLPLLAIAPIIPVLLLVVVLHWSERSAMPLAFLVTAALAYSIWQYLGSRLLLLSSKVSL